MKVAYVSSVLSYYSEGFDLNKCLMQTPFFMQVHYHPDVETFVSSKVNVKCELSLEGNMNSQAILNQPSIGVSNIEGEGMKKYDSFSKWMSKELVEEVEESPMKSTSQAYWKFMESERIDDSGMINLEQDAFVVGPSVSQDQLFSIIDFSPNWAYTGVETKVGIF